ncbi:phage portal protein [Paenibacillus sp. FSL R7-0273]|uniref:putative phage tail protein n=1 Tax=Paenibacillus sp. FSL R7-0273 TaxID=1536772 RepID=UPI0004F81254|nr:putative phage tail protein [Paenibacillus sp. FSL R7-0273]AIQ45628.1 phage portal protein [Paenibacillus sp. FSL R7-0273]OMF95148.1 phage portal protein [Paenibacillus sp. FSL R7-0273]
MSSTDRLKGYLPGYYAEIVEMNELLEAEGPEFDLLGSRVEELLHQAYPEYATWALDRFENELHIVVDAGKPIDQRRSVIISKMRGYGKVSGDMIKNVAQAYDGGTVAVAVVPAEYRIIITFVDTLGIPPNLDDLKQALEDLKPAHMALEYKYRYLLLREVQAMTLNQLQQRKLTDFAPFLDT